MTSYGMPESAWIDCHPRTEHRATARSRHEAAEYTGLSLRRKTGSGNV